MDIRIGYRIAFDLPVATPMLLLLRVHPSVEANLVRPENLEIAPKVDVTEFLDPFGNREASILAPAGRLVISSDAIAQDSGQPDRISPHALQHRVSDLPPEVIPFLLASRYCEVDRLGEAAWRLFGATAPGWSRVQAVCDWVHNHIEFGYHHASPTKTAHDAFVQAKGVCRDFTHLAITFCRCLNIPARYATGYLGDIGVPPAPSPMDFSAWFEVYLDGGWHIFDARHNIPRIGRVLMARGRDAVDAALTTSFGATELKEFLVWTDEVIDEK